MSRSPVWIGMTTRERLKARDCCFCDHYVVDIERGIVVRRGCLLKQSFHPEFKVSQDLDCFIREAKG